MKKVLAWAVALALVLSSFTMAFAADAAKTSKDFKDASSINYTEAVDVMVATGIINGYPDGTFGPAKTVKRSEMAKMIACIMNGGEDVGDQYKSACPFADSKDHWAAGYIAFCASEHIIDGRSADVFDPEAEVTGTEVAKMALTSLGYDSKIQGYTGENWAAAVLKDAKKNDLFDGLDSSFVPGDPCNRESAAQILFNMLKATEVEYTNGTSVSVGDDISVVVDSTLKPVEPSRKDAAKFGETLELFEDVFGGKLAKTEGTDSEGNPAHTWTYPDKKTEIGTYADEADYNFNVEDAKDVAAAIKAYDEDLAKDLDPKAYDYKYVLNGQDKGATAPAIKLGDSINLYVKEAADETSKGEVKVVIMQYVPYMITKVDTDVRKVDAENDVTAYVFLTQNGESGAVKYNDTAIEGYDASTYVKDAVIAVAWGKKDNKDAIIDSYVLEEAANGSVEKLFSTAATINGTKYDFTGSYTGTGVDGNDLVAKEDATFALYDYNGYVITSVQGEEAATDVFYGVVTVKGNDTATFGEQTNYLKIFTAEGEKTIAVADAYVEPEKQDDPKIDDKFIGKGDMNPAVLVSYTLNEDGEIDSIIEAPAAPDAIKTGATMQNEGVLAGKTVSEDVAAFYYNTTDKEWVAYGFDDMNKEDVTVTADYAILDEDAIVALLLKNDLVDTSTDAIYGFVIEKTPYSSGGDSYIDVKAFVDGEEVTYTTAKNTSLGNFNADDLVIFTLNSDEELTGIAKAEPLATENVTAPFEFDKDAYKAAAIKDKAVVGKKNNSVDIGIADNPETINVDETSHDYQNVGSAIVYYVNEEGALEVSSIGQMNVNENVKVYLYQTDSSKKVWNIVVFTDANSKIPGSTSPAVGG